MSVYLIETKFKGLWNDQLFINTNPYGVDAGGKIRVDIEEDAEKLLGCPGFEQLHVAKKKPVKKGLKKAVEEDYVV